MIWKRTASELLILHCERENTPGHYAFYVLGRPSPLPAMLSVFRLTLFLTLLLSGFCHELAPPKGWTLENRHPLLVYSSIDQRANRGLRIEMRDAEAPQGELQAYLESKLAELRYPAEATRGCRPRSRRNGKEVSCSTTSPEGAHTFYAIRTNDGQFRFVHVLAVPTLSVMLPQLMNTKRILDAAENNLGRSADSASNAELAEERAAPPATDNLPVERSYSPAGRDAGAPVAASATPVDSRLPFAVEGIYLHLKYTTGVGGGVYPEYRPYLYLSNGWVTTDLAVYPRNAAEFESWRQRRPAAWGRWTRSGDTIRIEWNPGSRGPRKPETLTKWFVALPGSSGMTLQDSYQSLGGGGNTALGGDFMVAAWRNLEFQPGNRVKRGGGASASSGGGGTGVSTTTSSRRPEELLSYRVEGHRIDFTDAAGQTKSEWFFLFPDGEKVIGVANSVYRKGK